ncbi:hypothetical protein, partial [Paraburkholderia fungorum]|uniref:hypothetical protein n=2 Tax=Burkholderiaceae TaxID=119060 RepID=UPI000DB4D630
MKTITQRILSAVASRGRYCVLHATVLTLIATAIFMMATSGDLGPMAPLIIAGSFYLIFAAVAIEAFLGLFALLRWLAR